MPFKTKAEKTAYDKHRWNKIKKNKKLIKCRNEYRKKHRLALKIIIIDFYSNGTMICGCCGEKIFEFLTIDHIKGGGRKHKQSIHNHLYQWLINNNFPPGYIVRCFNCNSGRDVNGGICPHEEIK